MESSFILSLALMIDLLRTRQSAEIRWKRRKAYYSE